MFFPPSERSGESRIRLGCVRGRSARRDVEVLAFLRASSVNVFPCAQGCLFTVKQYVSALQASVVEFY